MLLLGMLEDSFTINDKPAALFTSFWSRKLCGISAIQDFLSKPVSCARITSKDVQVGNKPPAQAGSGNSGELPGACHAIATAGGISVTASV